MVTCSNCQKNNCVNVCSKCKRAYYCDENCQKAHWDYHKLVCKRTIDFDLLSKTICSQLLSGSDIGIHNVMFYGKRMISGELYWFFKYVKEIIHGNVEQHYTKYKNLASMTRHEFANYYFTGKCSLFSFGIAFSIYYLLKNRNIKMYDSFIKNIYILHIDITKLFVTNVISYQFPIPTDNDTKDWDCDRLHHRKHQAIGVLLDDGSEYLIDFTAAQYGVYTQDSFDNWLHIEEISNTLVNKKNHKFSYGVIHLVSDVDTELMQNVYNDIDIERSDTIRRVYNSIIKYY